MNPELSVIVPVYNEAESLPQCHTRIKNVLFAQGLRYEIIFIDDGSSDESANILETIALQDSEVKIIFLSRNFGKEAALSAGIDYSLGEAVIVLDADLQDPPELIPEMMRVWKEKNVDSVLMRRTERSGESQTKIKSAYWFYRILNKLSYFHIPEDVGDFRLMNRKTVDALKKLPERNRYTKGLFAWVGMETYTMEYQREPRIAGEVKQNYASLFYLAFEGITSFSTHPLRISSYMGLVSALFGFFFGVFIVLKALFLGDVVHGYPSMIAIVTLLGGVQLLSIGIMGEYVGKTYIETKKRPIYLVKKFLSSKREDD